jgi:hypothetical protein
MQVLTTAAALGRPRDGRQHASAHHGARGRPRDGQGCGDGRAPWRAPGRARREMAPWRAPGRARREIPPCATLISLKVDQRCVVSSRDRACQMRDGGVIASAPATRPLVACICHLLRPKSRADEGDVVVDPIHRAPSRTAKPFNYDYTYTGRTSYNQANDENRRTDAHTKHLAHTRYQIPP